MTEISIATEPSSVRAELPPPEKHAVPCRMTRPEERKALTYLERTFVRHGHPRHLIPAYLGWMWAVYFLWFHNWIGAITALVLSGVLGRILTLQIDVEKYAETLLGKLMLLHLHPANLVIQLAGVGVALYSVWMHSGLYILLGLTVIMLGHLWGWHKVHEAL